MFIVRNGAHDSLLRPPHTLCQNTFAATLLLVSLPVKGQFKTRFFKTRSRENELLPMIKIFWTHVKYYAL